MEPVREVLVREVPVWEVPGRGPLVQEPGQVELDWEELCPVELGQEVLDRVVLDWEELCPVERVHEVLDRVGLDQVATAREELD